MSGALALLFILAVTLAIVRVAGVALRLTGLPQPVARFQSISALTGTGFTTSEAEGTMHHPTRRRILTLLMFTGHLGVVSLASTVILTMTSAQGASNIVLQMLAMIVAVFVIGILAANKKMDVVPACHGRHARADRGRSHSDLCSPGGSAQMDALRERFPIGGQEMNPYKGSLH